MPRYEYDVVHLKVTHDEHDRRCFSWRSTKGGCHDVAHDGLEGMLNRLGQEGWHVVSHDTDSRMGSNLILQRVVDDSAPSHEGKRGRTVVLTDPKAVEAVDAVKGEIVALRQALATPAPAPERTIALTDPALLAAIHGMADRFEAARPQGPTTAILDPTALAALEAFATREQPAPNISASLDAASLSTLEATLTRALSGHTTTLSTDAVQMLTAAIESTKREDPPAGPALAILSDQAVAQLGALMTQTLPVPQVNVRAVIDPAQLEALRPQITPATFERLEEAIRCAMARPIQPSIAVLDEGSEARLAALLSRMPQPKLLFDTVLMRSAFIDAVECLPRPEVQALPTTLAPEAVHALITAMERVLLKLPTPAPTRVTAVLDEASVSRLERAITSAVAEALVPKVEPVIPPRPIWNRIASRLGLAAN